MLTDYNSILDNLTYVKYLYTISEAAASLSLSRSTVYNLIARGDLSSVRIGRSVRISKVDLEAYVELLRNQGRP